MIGARSTTASASPSSSLLAGTDAGGGAYFKAAVDCAFNFAAFFFAAASAFPTVAFALSGDAIPVPTGASSAPILLFLFFSMSFFLISTFFSPGMVASD